MSRFAVVAPQPYASLASQSRLSRGQYSGEAPGVGLRIAASERRLVSRYTASMTSAAIDPASSCIPTADAHSVSTWHQDGQIVQGGTACCLISLRSASICSGVAISPRAGVSERAEKRVLLEPQ